MSKLIVIGVLFLILLCFGCVENNKFNDEFNLDLNVDLNQPLFVEGYLSYPSLSVIDNNIETSFLDLNVIELRGKDYDLVFYLDENNNWKELEKSEGEIKYK